MDNNFFYNVSSEHIFKKFASDPSGLTEKEVIKRQKKYGSNELPKEKAFSSLRLFLDQFKNPLIFILVAALIISVFSGHSSDAIIIAAVVLVTNTIGWLQERKANRALNQLNQIIVYKVKVLRANQLQIVRREELVAGDVIEVVAGDMIPADARLFRVKDLKVAEAALTGESLPVKKIIKELPLEIPLADRTNMICQGTVVVEGSGWAVITAIGQETEIGKVASLIKETQEGLTPLQHQINRFGIRLGLFLIAINILIFIIGILSGRPLFEMFMISVAIVVSAVPEGLIPAMSIILAIGMQRLIKKQGLVRRAIAAETLGSVSVICVDKTGTLTQGEMLVDKIITHVGSHAFKDSRSKSKKLEINKSTWTALKIATISNNALVENPREELANWKVNGSPTEKALLLAGAATGFQRANLELVEPRLEEIPFSSDLKMMATLHQGANGGCLIYLKGAPEKILALATKIDIEGQETRLTKEKKEELIKKMDSLTDQGQRVLAVAYKKHDKAWRKKDFTIADLEEITLVGLISLKDQIRPGVKEAIDLCRQASIRLIIITGDQIRTAAAIAKELDFKITAKNSIEGPELDQLSDEELKDRVKEIRLYARVDPRHKLCIVSALQEIGKVVAMTGDGINDAPALKKADIGVAVGQGTDVAKEVADLVLLDNSFMTIVEAVRQGRITFNNIRKVIVYLFSDCFQEMVIIGTAVLLGWPLPILPAQVLWIKLIEDPLPATSLSFDQTQENVMDDNPRPREQSFLTLELQKVIIFYALVMDVLALGLFYYYWKIGGNLTEARTIMFAAIGLSTMFYIYAIRGLKKSIFRINPFSNRFLVFATIFGLGAIIVSIYLPFFNNLLQTTPIPLLDWIPIAAYSFCSILVFETGKWLARLKFNIRVKKTD